MIPAVDAGRRQSLRTLPLSLILNSWNTVSGVSLFIYEIIWRGKGSKVRRGIAGKWRNVIYYVICIFVLPYVTGPALPYLQSQVLDD